MPSTVTTLAEAPDEVLVLSLDDLDQDLPPQPRPLNADADDVIDDEKQQLPVSRSKLYTMVLADFGLAFTWLCKFAVATPYFEHSLKAGVFLSHLVWIMGPLSGLIVAPLVGVLSDRCTSSFGRRRPFILGGVVFSIVGMNVFANAARITLGNLFAARLLAIAAFGVLDFSTNAIMFPSRALLGDLLPSDQQHAVQSAAAVVASIAELCAGAYITSWKNPVTHVARIFVVASVFLAISCAISLIVCVEKPLREGPATSRRESVDDTRRGLVGGTDGEADSAGLDRRERSSASASGGKPGAVLDADQAMAGNPRRTGPAEQTGGGGGSGDDSDVIPAEEGVYDDGSGAAAESWHREVISSIRTAVQNFPRPLIKVGIVYGLAWFLWFASLPYYSQWLGTDVLKGDAHAEPGTAAAEAYQHGVRVFSIANAAKALLAIVFSAFYPTIIKFVGAVGERVVFGVSFLAFSGVLFACAFTSNVVVAALVIALGSVPFIVTQTIPIAIVVQRFPERLASNLGVLNLFCVVPQLIDTLYTGKVAELAGESVVLRVAACWGFAASLAAFVCL